jgi:hypothetical protein
MTIERSGAVGEDSPSDVPRQPQVRELSATELVTAQRCVEEIAGIFIEFARALISQREANESSLEN